MDKVIPGRFRLRGMFLSEMYGILLFLGKKAYESGDIEREEFITRLQLARLVLEESIEVHNDNGTYLDFPISSSHLSYARII